MSFIALTVAILKNFIRDKRSLILLIVLPILLVSGISASFNPDGLSNIHGGVVVTGDIEIKTLKEDFLTFLVVSQYATKEDCIASLKAGREYICIELTSGEQITANIHYDNTKEPVIWEILQWTQRSLDAYTRLEGVRRTQELLSQIESNEMQLSNAGSEISSTEDLLDYYSDQIDDAQDDIVQADADLAQVLSQMKSDIRRVDDEVTEFRHEKNIIYSDTITGLNIIESQFVQIYTGNNSALMQIQSQGLAEVQDARREIHAQNDEAEQMISEIRRSTKRYHVAHSQGEDVRADLQVVQSQLSAAQWQIRNSKDKLDELRSIVAEARQEVDAIGSMDARTLVSPLEQQDTPVYLGPPIDLTGLSDEQVEELVRKGMSLLHLQTLFPTVMMLLALFLSLLVGSFSTLVHVNSPAYTRIVRVKNVWIKELFALYLSSILVLLVPIGLLLLAGKLIFGIPMGVNLLGFSLIVFFGLSIIVLLGILIALIIRKESISLVVVTFLFVIGTFLSGFLLPTERMSWIASHVSSVMPTKIMHIAFSKLIFYNQPFYFVSRELSTLLVMTLAFIAIACIIQSYIHNKRV